MKVRVFLVAEQEFYGAAPYSACRAGIIRRAAVYPRTSATPSSRRSPVTPKSYRRSIEFASNDKHGAAPCSVTIRAIYSRI
jgi:hypothetical protein